MAEEEVDRRRAVRCRAKTVDGKRSGLGEVRDRHDESDFGAEKDLDFVADHMDWRGRIRGRAAASGGDSGGVPYPAQEGRDRASVNPDTASTQDSESVQETSSEGSDA